MPSVLESPQPAVRASRSHQSELSSKSRSDTPLPVAQAPRWQEDALALGVLLALCALLFWLGLDAYPLLDVDEPRYPQTAYEMAQQGQWLIPYFNNALRLDKPPLIYWLDGLAFHWLGVSVFTARLWSALPATLLVTLLYGLCRATKAFAVKEALLLAAVAACTLQGIALARFATPDMLLSFCMLATVGGFAMLLNRSNPRWWLVAGFFAGLGTLAKGPVAIVLPGLVMLAYTVWTGRLRSVFVNRYFPLALGVWALIGLPWYGLAAQKLGPLFWDALYLHNVTRYNDSVSGHGKPWFFYIPVLLAGLLPWTLFLPVLPQWVTRQAWFKPAFLLRQTPENIPALSNKADLLGLLTFWSLGVFLFYSAATSKLLTYILPMIAPLALVTGAALLSTKAWPQQPQSQWQHRYYLVFAALTGALLLAGGVCLAWPNLLLPLLEAKLAVKPLAFFLPLLSLTAGFALVAQAFKRRRNYRALLFLVFTVALLPQQILWGWMPGIEKTVNGGLREATAQIPEGAPFAFYSGFKPSVVWQRKQTLQYHPTEREVSAAIEQLRISRSPSCAYWLVKRRYLPGLLQSLRHHDLPVSILTHDSKVRFLAVKACLPEAEPA